MSSPHHVQHIPTHLPITCPDEEDDEERREATEEEEPSDDLGEAGDDRGSLGGDSGTDGRWECPLMSSNPLNHFGIVLVAYLPCHLQLGCLNDLSVHPHSSN